MNNYVLMWLVLKEKLNNLYKIRCSNENKEYVLKNLLVSIASSLNLNSNKLYKQK